jgi:hypothetical protein
MTSCATSLVAVTYAGVSGGGGGLKASRRTALGRCELSGLSVPTCPGPHSAARRVIMVSSLSGPGTGGRNISACAGRGARDVSSIRIDSTGAAGGDASRFSLISVSIARAPVVGAASTTGRVSRRCSASPIVNSSSPAASPRSSSRAARRSSIARRTKASGSSVSMPYSNSTDSMKTSVRRRIKPRQVPQPLEPPAPQRRRQFRAALACGEIETIERQPVDKFALAPWWNYPDAAAAGDQMGELRLAAMPKAASSPTRCTRRASSEAIASSLIWRSNPVQFLHITLSC